MVNEPKVPHHTSVNDSFLGFFSAIDPSRTHAQQGLHGGARRPYRPPISLYLPEIVEDVRAPVGTVQNLDELADDGQLPLHHSDVESPAKEKKGKRSSAFSHQWLWETRVHFCVSQFGL